MHSRSDLLIDDDLLLLNMNANSSSGGLNNGGSFKATTTCKNMNIDSSLLMKNNNNLNNQQYSPPIYQHQYQHQRQTQQQQQQQQQHQLQYRKVRPEPINEKTLVGSVVGFLQDVVGADTNKQSQMHQTHSSTHHHKSTSSHHNQSNSNIPNEIKEQIEWLHFENFTLLDPNLSTCKANLSNLSKTPFANCNILLIVGYKTGFSIWTIDLNGVATEALSIREPNITHVKLLQIESSQRLLIAISKLIINDNLPSQLSSNGSTSNLISLSTSPSDDLLNNEVHHSITSSSTIASNSTSNSKNVIQTTTICPQISQQQQQQMQTIKKYNISIVNLLNGDCLREIVFNGDILEIKSNSDLLCINSWNRIDAFDLNTFEHRFSINSCYSQVSKSTGKTINPFALGFRWLAFADNKYHAILGSLGGVSNDIEQSYTATVLNTAKSISKGLVKISESVVNSVVSKSKNSTSNTNSSNGPQSPRLGTGKQRHDSKEEFRSGICTIVDTKKYVNNSFKPQHLHDENQNWIIAHFFAHQEPIYALEFNPSGRLLVTADSLGQYFNVYQINPNACKCTRTVVKHIYSLHRGDTNAKVRNISFSSDSRWLAIGTKRGTTHIFPINSEGGPVNARTHSKPFLVNRTTKHQRTAGFIDQDELLNLNTHSNKAPNQNNTNDDNYNENPYAPIVINNNPKLKNLLEPFVIPAYGQLKQPNANSSFQSSVISSNNSNSSSNGGLLACVSSQPISNAHQSNASLSLGSNMSLTGLTGSNLAASAFQSAALVTENVTNFASNTSNMIQYDNVCAVAVFAETRGYLSPEEPREYTLNRIKPANSLFVISDVNGNLVEYVLDVVIDTSKAPGNKPTNDSPIQLKITPKAQWPLQRFISSDEIRYPIQIDNPLLRNGFNRNSFVKQNSNPSYSNDNNGLYSNISINGYSPNSLASSNSPSLFNTPPTSISHTQTNNNCSNDWIKMIDVNTHIGPHRRLFMGPQFIFKTFNSNLTTTMVNASSSSVIGDSETPIIDLSGDIELNSLDLSSANRKYSNKFNYHTTLPMQINSKSKNQKFDCTPTFIEIGAGSYQEGMPIMCGSNGSRGSQKSLNNNPIQCDLLGDNIIESLADAMNELNPNSMMPNQINTKTQIQSSKSSNSKSISPAIAIANNKINDPNLLLINANTVLAPSSDGSSSSVFTVGSYFLINPNISNGNAGPIVNTSITSCTSSSSASSSSSGSSSNSQNDDDSVSSNDVIRRTRNHLTCESSSIENNFFQDENLLQ